ncbi:unnamed protein product [Adineta steineri]|uniref:G-protein coupled receptors family 3 profile domain-containing protein n=1 Tax=Adineta steineri TaxID=433720 RepID=A0A813Q2R5_9BILA|nr:unnamed protein product [Adineta steineri]CAF3812080.1 unnamed protein product [Adineta steineri]
MNEINMNLPSFNSSIIQSQSFYIPPKLIDNNTHNHHLHHYHPPQSVNNQTLSLLSFHNSWIFPIFILSIFGIIFTIIILYLFLYISIRRLNNHLVLTNLFICFSVCFIYIIVIFFLIRGNELFCSLREFLSQLAYALLYSALLCRYIMQWLAARILSKRTKQLTALLIYLLLICIQIPIGILWWYFTFPRSCQQQQLINEYPKFQFQFQKQISLSSSIKPCSHQCIVDYRFYATYTYTIVELFLCTIIAICLFLCRYCHRNKAEKEQLLRIHKNNASLSFFNMFAFILIDIVWLLWTFIYHYTHPSFAFPSLIIGMFTIGTICLLFILIPQIYFYSKIKLNDVNITQTTLFTNKLTNIGDSKDKDSLLREKPEDNNDINNKQQIASNESELSYELGTSGTFLPITRTPRGPFKVINVDKIVSTKTHDMPNNKEHSNTIQRSNESTKSERKSDTSITNVINQQEQCLQSSVMPLQRQSTSSTINSNCLNPATRTEYSQRFNPNIHSSPSTSMYYPSHHDETIIPILCSSQNPQTTPVKMRIVLKSPSFSVPKAQRMYSGADHRYVQYPYQHRLSPPPHTSPLLPPRSSSSSQATPSYYSSPTQQHYVLVDPYRAIPSYSGNNMWQPGTPSLSHRYSYVHRRYPADNRSLSQRLWDIDSGDDEDEIEVNVHNSHSHATSMSEHLKDYRTGQSEHDDRIILHMDADEEEEEEEESYNKKLVYV